MRTIVVGLALRLVALATVAMSNAAPEATALPGPSRAVTLQVGRDPHPGVPSSRVTYVYDADGNLEKVVDLDAPFVYRSRQTH